MRRDKRNLYLATNVIKALAQSGIILETLQKFASSWQIIVPHNSFEANRLMTESQTKELIVFGNESECCFKITEDGKIQQIHMDEDEPHTIWVEPDSVNQLDCSLFASIIQRLTDFGWVLVIPSNASKTIMLFQENPYLLEDSISNGSMRFGTPNDSVLKISRHGEVMVASSEVHLS